MWLTVRCCCHVISSALARRGVQRGEVEFSGEVIPAASAAVQDIQKNVWRVYWKGIASFILTVWNQKQQKNLDSEMLARVPSYQRDSLFLCRWRNLTNTTEWSDNFPGRSEIWYHATLGFISLPLWNVYKPPIVDRIADLSNAYNGKRFPVIIKE